MLYLEPPFHMIEGVSLFRDHADARQWYYLPIGPRLTTVPDTARETRVPQIQLIKYRGSAGSGGFVNFDVDLGLDEDQLEEIAREIKSRESLPDRPRLAPVMPIDGSVRLLLFDHESTPPAPPGPGVAPAVPSPSGGRFVLKADHAAKPALYGDNRAAFSVELSQRGVTILEQALKGEMSPIGVVYNLDFLALRPAYHVHLHVEWDRVQHHLEEHFSVSIPLVYQSTIDEIVDELIETQAIVLEVDTFIPEGDEGGGVIERRDQAVNDLRDMITETFFEPSLEPIPRQDETERDLKTAERVVQMIATGGVGGSAMFSYSKTDITRIDRKRLDVNMRERTTVKRSIYPQGHLTGLFRALREGADPERFILSVDTDDPWFERRRVHVISRADFAGDDIGSVNVQLDYGGEPKNVILDSAHLEADVDWGSRIVNGAMERDVSYRYRVMFQDVEGNERPQIIESPSRTVSVVNLEVMPRELYSISPVPIIALNFPWDRYSHVEVQTRYADPDNGIRQDDSFLLDKDHAEQTWKMFIRDPDRTSFSYKLVHRGVDHRDLVGPWIETDEERIVLRDPFPAVRSLMIVPAFDWTQVDRAFVDVSYHDDTHGIVKEETFEFTAEAKATRTFRVALEDPERRLVSYRVTIIGKDGSVVEIPPSFTLEPRITVRGDMRGHRIVTFQAEPKDFAASKVREMTVQARYHDPEHGLQFADSFVLKAAGDSAHFEYDYVDGGPDVFEFKVVRRLTNGLARETQWTSSGETELTVPVSS